MNESQSNDSIADVQKRFLLCYRKKQCEILRTINMEDLADDKEVKKKRKKGSGKKTCNFLNEKSNAVIESLLFLFYFSI